MVDVKIGKNCVIEDGVTLGYDNLSKLRKDFENKSKAVVIGDNVKIRKGSIIYAGCTIGNTINC